MEQEEEDRRVDQQIYEKVKEQSWTGQFLGPHSYGFHVTPRGVIQAVCEQNLPYDEMPPEEYTSYIQDVITARKEQIENIPKHRAKRLAAVAAKFNDGAVYLLFRASGITGGGYLMAQDSFYLLDSPAPQLAGAVGASIAARGVPSTLHSMHRFYSNLEPGTEFSQVDLYEEAVDELDICGVEEITDEVENEYFHPFGAKHRLAFYDEAEDVWRRKPYLGWKNLPAQLGEKVRDRVEPYLERD